MMSGLLFGQGLGPRLLEDLIIEDVEIQGVNTAITKLAFIQTF